MTAKYIIYDVEEIAKNVSQALPHYTKEELMQWSIPCIVEYVESCGDILFGGTDERKNK